MAIYGYARVSTDGQSLAAQIAELKAAKLGVPTGQRPQIGRYFLSKQVLTIYPSCWHRHRARVLRGDNHANSLTQKGAPGRARMSSIASPVW